MHGGSTGSTAPAKTRQVARIGGPGPASVGPPARNRGPDRPAKASINPSVPSIRPIRHGAGRSGQEHRGGDLARNPPRVAARESQDRDSLAARPFELAPAVLDRGATEGAS